MSAELSCACMLRTGHSGVTSLGNWFVAFHRLALGHVCFLDSVLYPNSIRQWQIPDLQIHPGRILETGEL